MRENWRFTLKTYILPPNIFLFLIDNINSFDP